MKALARTLLLFLLAFSAAGVRAGTCVTSTAPDANGVSYVIATAQPADISTCDLVLVSGSEWSSYQSTSQQVNTPFDPTYAGGLFVFFFTSPLVCYLIAKTGYMVVAAIKKS